MQILAGRTPLAKAAARGTLAEWGPLHNAAAYDLDVLQRLSLAESTLAGVHQGCCAQQKLLLLRTAANYFLPVRVGLQVSATLRRGWEACVMVRQTMCSHQQLW
jgi:hypothetical protein